MRPKSPQPSDAEMKREGHLIEKGPGELRALITGFLGSVPGAFIVLDKQWRLVYLNVDAQKILMVTDKSLIGRPFDEIYPRHFSHLLSPQAVWGLLEGKENTVTRYSNYLSKWFKVTAYSSDPYVFIRLEDVTAEMLVNRLHIMNQRSIDSAMDMVFWLKPSGHIIYANTALSNTLGLYKRELMSMMVADIDPSFTGDKWAEFFEGLRTRGSTVYESSLRASNRSIIPVEVTFSYLNYHGEEYLIAFARDIRKRKQDEEALKESESQLRAVFKSMTEGVIISDAHGNVISFNDAAVKIHRYKDIGEWRRNLHDFPDTFELYDLDGGPLPVEEWPLSRALRGEIFASQEVVVKRKDTGYMGVWSYGGTPVYDTNNNFALMALTVEDITERKRTEDALHESEERFKVFMNNSSAIAWMKDAQGRYIYINKTYEEEFQVRAGDRLGKTDFDIWPRVVAEEFRKSDLAVMVSGRPAHVIEETPNSDGSTSYWFDAKFPFKDTAGNMFIGGIGVDITRQKQVEEALKEAKCRNELYVDLMGHDINNINQVAMGYLELAALTLNDDDKEPIQKALDALKNSASLIENVQKLKKLESGGLRTEAIDLNDVLLELKDQFKSSVDKDIKINYDPNPGCHVLANGLLMDVFSNIIGNAIKHTPGDHIVINVRLNHYQDDKEYYKVTVEDQGPGIADEMKHKIFNRLERGDTKARGKGLGLYLVKTLVDDFHGKVWVEDRVHGDRSKGSRFIVLLPVVQTGTGTVSSDLPHIGIVEDDATLLNLYKKILTKHGMLVDSIATNGIEAVDMVRNVPGLDILIMDHRMPGMTGLEAMREILNIAPRIKIIFISADAGIENEALEAGAKKFLRKPAKPKDIRQAIDDIM